MALIFECIQTEGIAELSYMLGDDSDGVAAVFDPTPDVEKYVELAREKKVSITHIFETHIHADLVSGARELCDRVQSAKIFVSHEEDAKYGFDHEKIADGDQFTFGKTLVTVRHTPGHTPEHVSLRRCGEGSRRHAVGRAHGRLAVRQLRGPAGSAGLERDREADEAALSHAARLLPHPA